MNMRQPETYFSATVSEADQKFAAAASAAGATVDQIRHPLRGPDGEALNVSVAEAGNLSARKALLVLSATHGVEGFAGAGIQTGLLENFSALNVAPDTKLVIVHLINPWGAAWSRREDHENIDLFRNFLYWDRQSEPDPLFDAWDEAADLAHLGKRTPAENAARIRPLVKAHGEARIIAAVRRGQHHKPKSLTYHGQGPCWSTRVLHRIVRERLAGCERLGVIDLHTGFGDYGAGMVISYDLEGDPRLERVRRWMGGDIYMPGADADTPPHHESPYAFIARLVPGLDVTAAILEFGTFPPSETRDLFTASLYYQLYGDPCSPQGVETRRRVRRFCYPEEDGWKRSVWTRGHEVVGRMLAGLGSWSRSEAA
jgi:Protein of unknown function (DUF2817)